MENISVIIPAQNEEENLPALFKSLEGIDDIMLVNHNSTDNTSKLAKKLGARVITQDNIGEIVTDEDIEQFKNDFNLEPSFKAGEKFHCGGREKNEIAELAVNDWIFQIDCDERVTWNLEEIKKLLPDYDQIHYKFIHTRDANGNPIHWFNHCKLYRKTHSRWVGRIHEVVTGDNPRTIITDKMVLNHYQKPRPYRAGYLPRLEFAVLKDRDIRTTFYLAREYFYNLQYENALQFFNQYLKIATWVPEITKAYIFMARCLWQLHRGDEARQHCLQAILRNPNSKEPLELMAEMSWPKEAEVWKRFTTQVKEESFHL